AMSAIAALFAMLRIVASDREAVHSHLARRVRARQGTQHELRRATCARQTHAPAIRRRAATQMRNIELVVLVLSAALVACGTGPGAKAPYALIQAQPIAPTDTTAPAYVMAIDGQQRALRSDGPVSTGPHTVDVSIQAPGGNTVRTALTIDAKGCKRYLLAAKRSSPTANDW